MKLWTRALCAISLGVLALLGTSQSGHFSLISPAMAALTTAEETQITNAINTKNTTTLTTTINSLVASDPTDAAAITNYAVTHDTAAAATIASTTIYALEALPKGLTLAQTVAAITQIVVQTEASVPSTATSLNATLTTTISTMVSSNPTQAGSIASTAAANDPALAATITSATITALETLPSHLTLAQAVALIAQTVVQVEASVPSTATSLNVTLTSTISSLVSINPTQAGAIANAVATNDPALAASITSTTITALQAQVTSGHLTLAQAVAYITQTVVQVEASVPSSAASLNATLTSTISTLVSSNPSLAGSIVGIVATNDPANAGNITSAAIAALEAQVTSGHLTLAQGEAYIVQSVIQTEASVPSTATSLNATLTNTITSLVASYPTQASVIASTAVANDPALAPALIKAAAQEANSKGQNPVTVTSAGITALEALPSGLTMAQAVTLITQTVVQIEASLPSTATQLNAALTGAISTLVSSNPSQAGSIVGAAAANDTSLAATITNTAIAALQAQVTSGHLTLAQGEAYIIQTVVQTEVSVPSTATSLNATLTSTIGTLVSSNLSQATSIITTAVTNDPGLAPALINAAVLADKSNALAVATAGIAALQTLPGGLSLAQAAAGITQTVVQVEASVPSTAASLNATLSSAINTLMSSNPSQAGSIAGAVATYDPSLAVTITNSAITTLEALPKGLTLAQAVADITQTIVQVEAAVPSTATSLNTTLTNTITTLISSNPSQASLIANTAAVADPSQTLAITNAAIAALQAQVSSGHLTEAQAETYAAQTVAVVEASDPPPLQAQLNSTLISNYNTTALNPSLTPTLASLESLAGAGASGYPTLAPSLINTVVQAALTRGFDPVAVTLAGVAALETLPGGLTLAQAETIITQILVQVETSVKLSATQKAQLENNAGEHIVNNQFASPH